MDKLKVSPTSDIGMIYSALMGWASEFIHYRTFRLTENIRLGKVLGQKLPFRIVSALCLTIFIFSNTPLHCSENVAFPTTNNPAQNSNMALIDLNAIRIIESSSNPKAIGDGGKALGLYQLHRDVIKDYNQFHNTSYLHTIALDTHISEQIASWYLHKRIPQLLRHYKQPVTELNVIASYNYGIGNVVKWQKSGGQFHKLPKTTQNYWKKYAASR